MRKPAAWILTLLVVLLGAGKLSALELYWWPVIDSNANDIRNWSIGSTGYALPGAADITGANLHFFGSGADLNDCTFTADASVAGIDGTIFFQNRTLSDGGHTLTLSGGFSLTHGTLDLTGVLNFLVSGASTISLGTPPGENLHTVQANISTTGGVRMLTDINVAGLAVSGTGAWDWDNQRVLTLRGDYTSAAFADAISFLNVRSAPLSSKIICAGTGNTLILPSANEQPDLEIQISTGLASADGTELILDVSNLTLLDSAALTLNNDLAFTGTATITQGASSLIMSNGGSFVWREVSDFPTASGLQIDAPVVISQAVTGTAIDLTLPGGWAFGNSLTFLANDNVTANPDMLVHLDGSISATNISFENTVANTEITVSFDASGASLTASGTVGINSSYLQVNWLANSAPVLVTADSFDASDPFSALSLIWSSEGATLSADTSVSLPSMSTSDTYSLLLPGSGDGSGIIDLNLPNYPGPDISKTGSATRLNLLNNFFASTLTVRGNTSTTISGNDFYVGSSHTILLEDSGSINGDLIIESNLIIEPYSTLRVDDQALGARIIVTGDIYGYDGEVYHGTDINVVGGEFEVVGDDNRSDEGGPVPSITYVSGPDARAIYTGYGLEIDVIATGDGATLAGTGEVLSYVTTAPYDVWVEPGDDDFGVLTISDANFTAGSAGVTTWIELEASGSSSPGVDYDQIITTNLTINSGSTAFSVDLNGWSGDGQIDGIITYSTLTGDPATAVLNLYNATDLEAFLVNDPSNQEIDLVVNSTTGTPPSSGVLVTPKIPISSSRSTIWVALSPGTPEGLASLRRAIDGKSSDQVRAYIWDPTAQTYVAYPTEPMGGLQPWHGWFVATRTPLSFSFAGTFNGAPHETPLAPGWNFVGVGPVSDSSIDITSFPWDGLELWDNVDATVNDPTRSNTIGASASWWNVNRYSATTDMISGRAYWIFNTDTADYSLTYLAGSYTLPEYTEINATAKAATAAVDRKSPPPPPGFSDAANDAKGGGCGGGSGLSLILAFLALIGLRRQRLFAP